MAKRNEKLVRRWFEEVWNKRREGAIDEMLTENVSALGLPPEPMSGREAFKQFHRAFLAGFPQLHISVEEVISERDRVAFLCRVRATHQNGRSCEFAGGSFVRVRKGKMAIGHNIWNFHEMLEQLGAASENSVLNAVQGGE